jgi:iron(III) transport system substrate-binding protein
LNSVPIQQRYASEADAGAFAADVVTLGNSDQFLSDAIDKGWGMKITDAELPVLELGTFPEEFMQGDNTATVGVSPFLILYNKANVAEGDLPESLSDLTDPRFKDKILLADPSASDALTAFYIVLQEELGDEWFEGVMKNNPKFYPAVSAAGQAMVAGEGDFVTPALRAVGAALQDSGAPVDAVIPPVTTGPKFNLMLTATENSPNPNAAKLFANWLLSESGSIAAQGGVGLSPYQSDELPSGFVEMPEATPEKKAQVLSLLGLD